MLPTLEQLLTTFEAYNLDLWPMQILAYVLAIVALVLVFRRTPASDRIVTGIMAFLWLWTGIVFFLLYFARVYIPAYAFGVIFIIHGILLAADLFTPRLSYAYQGGGLAIVGLVLIAYAMVGYPLVGLIVGHRYPQSPPFGIAPCPLTVFTFGLYLLTNRPFPRRYLAVPLYWALSGVVPVSVGILEDIGLIISGIVATAMLVRRDKSAQ